MCVGVGVRACVRACVRSCVRVRLRACERAYKPVCVRVCEYIIHVTLLRSASCCPDGTSFIHPLL